MQFISFILVRTDKFPGFPQRPSTDWEFTPVLLVAAHPADEHTVLCRHLLTSSRL